uniref:MADS-box domain-containing protein n=1 Tax=Setaria italica TaxID=4555 RepID=K4A0T9_SETIT
MYVYLRMLSNKNGHECTNTLLSIAKDLSQEFGAHVTVIAFSPTGEPKAYGAPTTDSILRTYLPEIHTSPSPTCSEMAGEAAARVDEMKWEVEETAFLAKGERVREAAAWSKILAAQTSVGKQNWWEVDVEALGADELPVFVRASEVLRIDVQRDLNTMESSQKGKMQP